jgi:hypothetical protein
MNVLKNYNLAEQELIKKVKAIVQAKYGLKVYVDGFNTYSDGVSVSINYRDSANNFISRDVELELEDFEC